MTWTLLYRAASGVLRKLQENPGDQALLSQLQEVFNQASEAGMEENVKTVFSAPLATLGITLEQKKGGKGKRMPASPSIAFPPYKPYHPPQPTLPVILGDGSDPFKAMVVLVEESSKNPHHELSKHPAIRDALIAALMGNEKGATIPLDEEVNAEVIKMELTSTLQYKNKSKKVQKAQDYLYAWLKEVGENGKIVEIVDNIFKRNVEARKIRYGTLTKERPFIWELTQPFPIELAAPVFKERMGEDFRELTEARFMRDSVTGTYFVIGTVRLAYMGNLYTATLQSKVHKEGRTGYLPKGIHDAVDWQAVLSPKWRDLVEDASSLRGSPYQSEAVPVLNQALIYLHESPPKYRATGWPENWPVE